MNIDPEHFFELLKQFKKSYITYNLKPEENSRYELDSIKMLIEEKAGLLVSTINSFVAKIKSTIEENEKENGKADKNKKLFHFLNDKKKNLDGLDHSSSMLIVNFQELYKIQYIINILLFLGILMISYNLNKKE
jgi:outer membrane receptor for ferrienterochelin and colicin